MRSEHVKTLNYFVSTVTLLSYFQLKNFVAVFRQGDDKASGGGPAEAAEAGGRPGPCRHRRCTGPSLASAGAGSGLFAVGSPRWAPGPAGRLLPPHLSAAGQGHRHLLGKRNAAQTDPWGPRTARARGKDPPQGFGLPGTCEAAQAIGRAACATASRRLPARPPRLHFRPAVAPGGRAARMRGRGTAADGGAARARGPDGTCAVRPAAGPLRGNTAARACRRVGCTKALSSGGGGGVGK